MINIDVDQFYGIEIEEFPAQIAQVALWLTDHQINIKISVEFGAYFPRNPLKVTPHIVCANVLKTDWASVLPTERCSYVLGNPPFLGKSNQSAAQKADMQLVCGDIKNAGLLDFVAAWYIKAARYMQADNLTTHSNSVRPSHFSSQFTGLENWGRPLRSELVEGLNAAHGSTGSPRTGGEIKVALFPPTASPKVSKLACCGAGCWRKASKFTLPTARLAGITKRVVKLLCIA